MRRGVNMAYIVENNGVYGLTKGQFSATADQGCEEQEAAWSTATSRSTWSRMALQLGATFVARSFSGDKEQLVPLIKAALQHRRRRLHRRASALRRVQQPRRLDQELRLRARAQRGGEPARLHHRPRARSRPSTRPARCETVKQHDGSVLRLRKLADDYDAHDRIAAMTYLQERHAAARSSPACSTSIRSRTTCTTT